MKTYSQPRITVIALSPETVMQTGSFQVKSKTTSGDQLVRRRLWVDDEE